MARSLHVRLDDGSHAALDVIRSEGLSDSEAVRTALREGTQDAQLYFHAAVIERAAGDTSAARRYLDRALLLNPSLEERLPR